MGEMDEFDKIARRAEEERRKLERKLQEVEQLAQEDSYFVAAHLTVEALYWRRVWRRRLRKIVKRFGGRIVARNGKVLLINANPQWPREGFSFLCAGAEFSRWENIFGAMLEVSVAAEAAGEDPHLAAIREFIVGQRMVADLLAATARPLGVPPEAREWLAAVLTGHTSARVSLARNRRLAAAMREGGTPPAARLKQELPGAVMHEWGTTLDRASGFVSLLGRVTRLLEGQGSEQQRLERDGRLAGPRELDGGDEDMAEFERRETQRQDLQRLKGWIDQANFSPREARVYELDMSTNFDTEAIAHELEIKASTVRVLRKRYEDKIRKAARL